MTCAEFYTSVSELSGPSQIHRRCYGSRVGFKFLLVVALWMFPALCWGQRSQTIAFTQPPPQQAYAGTAVVLVATATSGLPVSFSVVSGPAQVSGVNGSTLTFIGVGTVVVQADQAGGSGYSAAPSLQAPAVTVALLTEPVTTQSTLITTVVTFTTAGTLAQASALTQGAANLDFSLYTSPVIASPSPFCSDGVAYTAGQTCLQQFYFKPTRPGIRYGGITLADAAGNLLANSYIYGYGVGPQVLYQPIVQTLVGNSLGQPSGVAVNGNGDLFVSNGTGAGLTEIAVNGTVTPIGNFTVGKDVAVDGSGNVFIITYDTLSEVMAVNGEIPASPVIRTLATGFTVSGGGLAIDGSGNAYIANSPLTTTVAVPTGVVYEVYAVGGVIPSGSSKQTIGPVFASPTGVAVDSSGNVYISDGYAPGIFEMLAVNGQVPATSPVVLSLGSGFVSPSNIRLDDTNDIFISDAGLPGILEYPAVNGVVAPSTLPKSIGSGFSYPQGLLVDDSGNVFVADQGYPQVVKLNYSSVPTLNFAPTTVGQTSTDSPQAVTYTNGGNADLVFMPLGSGSNPVITPGFTLGVSSTSSSCPQLTPGSAAVTLAVGQSCTDQVSFTPLAAGPQSGTLTTVDNDLSVANATQVVQLNGTGVLEVPTIVFNVGNHFVDDPPFTVAATSNSPAAFSYSVSSGPAAVAGSTVTLSGASGTVTLLASQAIDIPYGAGSAAASFNVAKHSQRINFPPLATPVSPTVSPVTLVATASSGLPVVFSVVSGPATVSGNQLRFTGYGQIVIAADQPGNAIYDAASEVTEPLFVLDNRVAVTLTGVPNPVFLKDPITFTATATPVSGTATGSMLFLDGSTPLATVPMSGGVASFTTSSLTLGLHNIIAVYSGDAVFATVTSAPLSVLVEEFSLAVSNPDVIISHGGTAVYNLTVTTVGGTFMASTIQFAVSGNPDRSPLTFSPPQIATGSGTTNVTLTIQTPDYPVGPWIPPSGQGVTLAVLSLGALFGLGGRRRLFGLRSSRIAILLLVLGMSAGAVTLSGCGSGWGPQSYPMTVTASSGALSHSVVLKLVSQ